MKIHPDCRPCLLNQMESAARAAGADTATCGKVAAAVTEELDRVWDDGLSPPEVSAPLYRLTGLICGQDDPFRREKIRYTRRALRLLPGIEQMVADAPDPFGAAVRVAIAGNVIDFGAGRHHGRGEGGAGDAFDLSGTLQRFMTRTMFVDDIEPMRTSADRARTILYIGDNAGETVFDRPLLAALGPDRVSYAARGGPIINDATVPDAKLAGVHRTARLISSGSRVPGTIPEQCSPAFREAFEEAGLIVAKGQGNFETLTELPREGRIFMLFMVKCPVAADHLGAEVGDMAVMRW